jgi:hypothetical protein
MGASYPDIAPEGSGGGMRETRATVAVHAIGRHGAFGRMV